MYGGTRGVTYGVTYGGTDAKIAAIDSLALWLHLNYLIPKWLGPIQAYDSCLGHTPVYSAVCTPLISLIPLYTGPSSPLCAGFMLRRPAIQKLLRRGLPAPRNPQRPSHSLAAPQRSAVAQRPPVRPCPPFYPITPAGSGPRATQGKEHGKHIE